MAVNSLVTGDLPPFLSSGVTGELLGVPAPGERALQPLVTQRSYRSAPPSYPQEFFAPFVFHLPLQDQLVIHQDHLILKLFP